MTSIHIAFSAVLLASIAAAPAPSGGSDHHHQAPQAKQKMPPAFVENGGQFDSEVSFVASGGGATAAVLSDGFAVRYASLYEPEKKDLAGMRSSFFDPRLSDQARFRGVVLRFRVEGAAAGATASGFEELTGRTNYLFGRDASSWRSNLKSYRGVRVDGVRPGVSLVMRESGGAMKYDVEVAPGVSEETVALTCEGADALEIAADGSLLAHTAAGVVRQPKPVTFEEEGSFRTPVETRFRLLGGNRFGFTAPSRHAARKLTIDPSLIYATFLPGSGNDSALDCAVDAQGNCYVTGWTLSSNFAVKGGSFDVSANGLLDAFVVKLNPAATDFVYATYLGGANYDQGLAIAVDSTGAAYVGGATLSATTFPVVPGSFDTVYALGTQYGDGFVAKLNPAGSSLVYCGFLGGLADDVVLRIALDTANRACVTGWTKSSDFPTTTNAFDKTYNDTGNGVFGDAYVVRLNSAGTSIDYSTFLGGPDPDAGAGIAVGSDNMIYVTGVAGSFFPVTTTAFDKTYGGGGDVFITKINPNAVSGAASMVYSTYAGGAAFDTGYGIAVDGSGQVFVCGQTSSGGVTAFPTTLGCFDKTYNGGTDAFVLSLNTTGTALVFSTFLGGTGNDTALTMKIDSNNVSYVCGRTTSTNFPSVVGAVDKTYGGGQDGFVAKLSAGGGVLLASTFLGGTAKDEVFGLALRAPDEVFVSGTTISSDFPHTVGVVDPTVGGQDAFVARVDFSPFPAIALAELIDTDKTNDTIVLEYLAGDPVPISTTRKVKNAGSPTSVLAYDVSEVVDAPWLTENPTSGLVVAEEAGDTVTISADATGLAVGPYTTTLRFTNSDTPTSFIDVPVLFTVQLPSSMPFVLGDQLSGNIDFQGEFDLGTFEALAGESLTFAVACTGAGETLKPELRLLNANDTLVKSFPFTHSTKVVKKTIKVTSSGTFKLRVDGLAATDGGYTVGTSSKLPANAKAVSKKNLAPKSNGFPVDVTIALKAGGKLDATVFPANIITGPLSIALLGPDLQPIDVSGFTQPFQTTGLQLVQVPVALTGAHTIRVSGLATKSEKVNVTATPSLPAGGAQVTLP